MKEVKNPSDILWLNRGVTRNSQMKRGILAMAIVFFSTVAVFIFFQFEMGLQIYIKLR